MDGGWVVEYCFGCVVVWFLHSMMADVAIAGYYHIVPLPGGQILP